MRRRGWALVGMLAAAVAVGGVANWIDNTYLASGWHSVQHGKEGQDSTVGNFQVRVHGATSSATLDDRDVLVSPGAFVVVDTAYATTDAWDTPEQVVLIDGDDREFTEPTGFGSDGRAWVAGPDIWFRGTLLFEVPADAVGDLTLEFRPQTPTAQLPSSVLRVPLTVTPSAKPVVLERATILAEGER